MSETKTFTVKITASQPGSWYSTYIGSKMIVYEYEGYLYLLEDFDPYAIGIGRYIRKEDCEVVPTPNPADMPSRPVEKWQHNEWVEVFKAYSMVNRGLKSEADIWLELSKKYSLVPRSAPSKEGASQSPIPEEITKWAEERISRYSPGAIIHDTCLDMATAMYHKLLEDWFNKGPQGYSMALEAIQKGIYSREEKIKALQSHLSSMTSQLAKANADFDVMVGNDTRQEGEIERLTAERDLLNNQYQFAHESSNNWRKEAFALAALLEGKNLEIAQLKEEAGEYRAALVIVQAGAYGPRYGGVFPEVVNALAKYKKEEQK